MILEVCVALLGLYFIIKYFSSCEKVDSSFKDLYEIPGPKGLPFLGNVGDFLCNEDDQWRINRERGLKYFPIYRMKMFNTNIVHLMHPDDIQMILNNSVQCSKGIVYNTLRRFTGNGLIVNEGELWHKRRKLLTKSFHFAVLNNYMDVFHKGIDSFVEEFKKHINQPIDVLPCILNQTLKIINDSIIGEKSGLNKLEEEKFKGAIKTMSNVIGYKASKLLGDFFYKYTDMKKKEDGAFEVIQEVSARIEKSGRLNFIPNESNHKMLDILIGATDLFNSEAVKDEIATFLFAGHDTSASVLSFTLLALANYSELQEEIYQEIIQISGKNGNPTFNDLKRMDLLDRFVKESMRLFPPALFLGRKLHEDIVTKTGYFIPMDTTIVLDIFDIHRNPNLFPEPNKFDPDRFLPDNIQKRHPFAYIPFSAGPRNCIAQKFAVLETKATICGILKKFKLEPVDLIEKLSFKIDVVLVAKGGVKMKFTTRT